MNQVELDNWGLTITRDVYDFWLTLSKQNTLIEKNGFSVFYSPLIFRPKYLFIGINPGGKYKENEKSFNPGDIIYEIPKKHDYISESYDLANAMKSLFSNDEIRNSVKFNFYYFRSSSANELYSFKEFKQIYKYCSDKTLKILEYLQPENIITEGLSIYDSLKTLMKFDSNSIVLKDPKLNKFRLIEISTKEYQKLIGLIHPSGSRTRNRFNENKQIIIDELRKNLN